MEKRRVLFVCIHNSARSQMAEGMLRAWAGDRFEVASGGTKARIGRSDRTTRPATSNGANPHRSTALTAERSL